MITSSWPLEAALVADCSGRGGVAETVHDGSERGATGGGEGRFVWLGRTEARCWPFGRSVSSARPPNPDVRLPRHPALHKLMSWATRSFLSPTA